MADNVKSMPSMLRRIFGVVVLVVLIGIFLLMFHKPAPVAHPMPRAEVAAHAQAFQQKLSSLSPAVAPADNDSSTASSAPAEVRLSAEEVQAALVEANAPAAGATAGSNSPSASSADKTKDEQITLTSAAPLVTFEDDVVKGQFQAELAGQKVIVTVAGHLGQKDGFATFEPTEFKIGGLKVPVSLVNDALQKKMQEQHDRMKLPDFISDINVQDSQLVIKRK